MHKHCSYCHKSWDATHLVFCWLSRHSLLNQLGRHQSLPIWKHQGCQQNTFLIPEEESHPKEESSFHCHAHLIQRFIPNKEESLCENPKEESSLHHQAHLIWRFLSGLYGEESLLHCRTHSTEHFFCISAAHPWACLARIVNQRALCCIRFQNSVGLGWICVVSGACRNFLRGKFLDENSHCCAS